MPPTNPRDTLARNWPHVGIIRHKSEGNPYGVLSRSGDQLAIVLAPDLAEDEETTTLRVLLGHLERLFPVAS